MNCRYGGFFLSQVAFTSWNGLTLRCDFCLIQNLKIRGTYVMHTTHCPPLTLSVGTETQVKSFLDVMQSQAANEDKSQ